MSERYVVALDAGTTSSRALLVDRSGAVRASVRRPFRQLYPHPGWAEQRPQDILSSQLGALTELLVSTGVTPHQVAGLGIANQRETTVVWDRATGEPVANAISWQCRRTAPLMERLFADARSRDLVRERTGLVPDAYFSASKARWILDSVPGAQERAERGELAFGTVDSWLLWSLTGGAVHATDPTNASRTMLFDIREGRWGQDLLDLFDIPRSMLPQVLPSSSVFGATANPALPQGIPVCGVAGDQQAALFGQCCFGAGQAKNTYGTGCFLLMHTGGEPCRSKHNLITTVAASAPGAAGPEYALEGSVFIAGALIQWLRDDLGIISDAAQTQELARSVPDNAGVYIVPAFTGLGAPWWDPDARGAIVGLTRGTGRAHLARAALESMAYQMADLCEAMQADAGRPIETLNVDGGAAANDFLLQFQSDVLRAPVLRPRCVESTALGAAYLAGLTCGFWEGADELRGLRADGELFRPQMDPGRASGLLAGWHDAVRRTLSGTEGRPAR